MHELEFISFFGIKVLVATICGLIVGWERELKNKVAGIRTNVLICVGCTIFSAISVYIWNVNSTEAHDWHNNPNSDPSRIIGQIVTGIGFLGAGVIYKHEGTVIGISSAAFIWVMAAIGVLIGLGFVIIPISLTVGLLLISFILQRLENFIKAKRNGRV
jgi:putative Mg2+ transporter-C (MgtC) family protein